MDTAATELYTYCHTLSLHDALPISAVITDDSGERRSYDLVLDEVSKPLMQAAREHIAFTSRHTTYPDGVVSNFEFNGDEQVRPVWRYLDLGPHVVYLSKIVKIGRASCRERVCQYV